MRDSGWNRLGDLAHLAHVHRTLTPRYDDPDDDRDDGSGGVSGLGIDPALITCDEDNIGSQKVIKSNGGQFDDQRGVKLRFCVPPS